MSDEEIKNFGKERYNLHKLNITQNIEKEAKNRAELECSREYPSKRSVENWIVCHSGVWEAYDKDIFKKKKESVK